MKTLLLTMFAAALVFAAASYSRAGMVSNEMAAIDSSRLAVVSISVPASHIAASSQETVTFDSNGLWVAADYSGVSPGTGLHSSDMSSHKPGKVYCFDVNSRFCALAF